MNILNCLVVIASSCSASWKLHNLLQNYFFFLSSFLSVLRWLLFTFNLGSLLELCAVELTHLQTQEKSVLGVRSQRV